MENMRVPELKALAREHGLRNYSWLRKAELIAFLQDNAPQGAPRGPQEPQAPRRQRLPRPSRSPWVPTLWRPPPPPSQMFTWEPVGDRPRQPKLEQAPLTKRQLKHRRNRDSKLAKNFKSLNAEISNLKSQMEALKDKIT